jgi:hypothetical protein
MRGLMPLGFVMCLQFGCSAGGERTGSAATPPSGSPSESDHSATSETHSVTSDARSEGKIVWPPTAASDSSPQLPFEPPPPAAPPIVQTQDPCGIMNCEAGRGCCHNPLAAEFNSYPREFLVDCLPEPVGEANAPLDAACEDYRCETLYCLWKGCRLESGVCGVRADEYVINARGPDVHGRVVKLNFGCVDERWLIRRNESGVPPDRTLECAVDYWWSDASASGSSGASVDASRGSFGGSLDAGRGSGLPVHDAGVENGLDASL